MSEFTDFIEELIIKIRIYSIIAWIIAIIIHYIIGRIGEDMATKKGYGKEAHIFALCFLFGLIGIFVVFALPSKNEKEGKVNSSQVWSKYKATRKIPDRYSCTKLTITEKITSGRCLLCKEYNSELRFCSIENESSTREIPICAKCQNILERNISTNKKD